MNSEYIADLVHMDYNRYRPYRGLDYMVRQFGAVHSKGCGSFRLTKDKDNCDQRLCGLDNHKGVDQKEPS